MASWKEWKKSDVIFGIIAPSIVAFLIIIFPLELSPILRDIDPSGGLNAILVDGLGEAILIAGIPMFLGLLWNQWAGGASGFLLGSIYALYVNDAFAAAGVWTESMMIGDISNLGYVVCAMLTGYIAGALNRGSYNFLRMLISGIVSGIIGGAFLLWTQVISPVGMMTDIYYGMFITFLPRIIYGVIIPIFAKIFSWYGVTPRHIS